ncbi:N-acetylmuramoyl-L-alanine amidase, partial [Gammaproteobacteria bacterium]|nr:N-acetylmuramoyl-L-alanine amidase [Gammaproteobacteria bacterium]
SVFINLKKGAYIQPQRIGQQVRLDVIGVNDAAKPRIRILLDAGHGGHDPGAMSAQGYLEKQVTLRFTQMLAQALQQPGVVVELTRDHDESIDKYTRLEKNIISKPDLFVSIHADAFSNNDTKGLGLFLLDPGSIASKQTQMILQRHNLNVEKQNQNANSIAQAALRYLQPKTVLHSKEVKYASLVVLRAPHIPSMLIEIGFLSNPEEAEMLNSDRYLEYLSKEVAMALLQHIDIV